MSNDRSVRRTFASWVWALLPLATLGLGTPLVFAFAAMRVRRRGFWLAMWSYIVVIVVLLFSSKSAMGSVGEAVFGTATMLLMLGGTVHAIVVRNWVLMRAAESERFDKAVQTARRRHELRVGASRLVRAHPEVAIEMRIGRPDLPRGYDDGGLVDINHAPAAVLAEVPGMTAELAGRVVDTRELCGGFVSAEEVAALAQLPPALTPQLTEYGVFLP